MILYVDTFGNPEHFTRIARRVSRHKPILAVKGRRSAARALADARSHTAAALRGDEVFDALLHQAGLLRFRSGDELFNAAEFFERQPLPAGRRIGIVSNSVGVATIAADAAAARGLEVREPDDVPNPLIAAGRRGTGRVRGRSRQAAGRIGNRRADGVLRRRPGGRPRRSAWDDYDGLRRTVQAGCRVRGALRRTSAAAHARRCPQFLVPGILRERARQRGRTSRNGYHGRWARSQTMPTSTGRRRGRSSTDSSTGTLRAGGSRLARLRPCWRRTGFRSSPRLAVGIWGARSRRRRRSAGRSS